MKLKLHYNAYMSIFVLLLLFLNDSFILLYNSNDLLVKFAQAITIILCSITTLFCLNTRVHKSIGFIILIVFSFIITMMMSGEFTAGYILKLAVLITALLTSTKINYNTFATYFVKWCVVISSFSIFFFTIRLFGTGFFYSMHIPIITNNSGSSMFFLLFTNIPVSTYGGILRNYGIWWEPGACQAFFNIAILYVLFEKSKIKNASFCLLILLVGVFITFSTTGWIVSLVIILAYLSSKKTSMRLIVPIVLILVALIVFIDDNILSSVFSKLTINQELNQSLYSRLRSVYDLFNISLQNPIFGVGIHKTQSLFTELSWQYGKGIVQSNTVFGSAAKFGWPICVYLLTLLRRTSKMYDKKRFTQFLIFIAYLTILFTEDFGLSIIIHLSIIEGMNYKRYRQNDDIAVLV